MGVAGPENANCQANVFVHSSTCLAAPLMTAAFLVCTLGTEQDVKVEEWVYS